MVRVDKGIGSISDILTPSLVRERDIIKGLAVSITSFNRFNIYVKDNKGNIIKEDTEKINNALNESCIVRVELEYSPTREERLILFSEKNLEQRFPAYLEFSVSSYKVPYYCMFGIVIASSEENCPLRDRCPIFKGSSSENCDYYRRSRSTFLGLYKLFIDKEIYIPEYIRVDRSVETFLDVNIDDKKLTLLTLSYAILPQIIETLACIRLERRENRDVGRPYIYLFVSSKRRPGRRIVDVPSLVITANVNVLKEVLRKIESLLLPSYAWLKFKYYILEKLSRNAKFFSSVIIGRRSRRLFKSFPREPYNRRFFITILDSIAEALTMDRSPILEFHRMVSIEDEIFMKYVEYVLLNTIAHILVGYICQEFGASPTYFNYIIDLENHRLIIYERCTGGLGHIDKFRNYVLESGTMYGNILLNVVREILEYGDKVENSSQRFRNLEDILKIIPQRKLSDQFLRNLERVKTIVTKLNSLGVHPPASQVRRALARNVVSMEDVMTYNEILDYYDYCLDGCTLCIIQEKFGVFSSEENMYLISKSLMKDILRLST